MAKHRRVIGTDEVEAASVPPAGRDDAVVDRSHVLTSRHAGAPVFLALDAMSGKLLGSSARDWRHAVADAPDDWQNGNLNWTDNAKVGDEFHGIRLQMGEVV